MLCTSHKGEGRVARKIMVQLAMLCVQEDPAVVWVLSFHMFDMDLAKTLVSVEYWFYFGPCHLWVIYCVSGINCLLYFLQIGFGVELDSNIPSSPFYFCTICKHLFLHIVTIMLNIFYLPPLAFNLACWLARIGKF